MVELSSQRIYINLEGGVEILILLTLVVVVVTTWWLFPMSSLIVFLLGGLWIGYEVFTAVEADDDVF